ncbi:hypothetical protein ACFSFZ_17100 [Mixta tenebrionis]|uniref:Uncharacterized protein n=1 Tax=Mixta tenebrionis TaxID=2562439 RepID=A0A506V3Z2_9GAMM|nr:MULTISPECIES: hypothetical protein [Mixta]QHM77809.1 hypothetical protein C7M52_03823 [Mixta theicola]TPW39863.1 hypothetical protein FKM52_18455 [Mixta tenebrionis]
MKELTIVDISEVSGAGKIEDALSKVFGDLFGDFNKKMAGKIGLEESYDEALQQGKTIGSHLGQAVEYWIKDALDSARDRILN